MILKTSLIASLLALSVFGAPILETRHGEDVLVGYIGDAKVKRVENDVLVGYPTQKLENDVLVGYYADAKVKRYPNRYKIQVAAADSVAVLGESA